MTRTCRACGVEQDLENFPLRKKGSESRQYECRPCFLKKRRERELEPARIAKAERYANDPEFRRRTLDIQHKWRYGITLAEKDALLEAQGGCCAICKTTEPGDRGWSTDHDHSCCPGIKSCGNCIRGVLCKRCNFALGQLDDNPENLRAAIEYLTRIPA